MSTSINSRELQDLFGSALFREEEVEGNKAPEGAVLVKSVAGHTFGFHPGRLEDCRQKLQAMIEELPDDFRENKGGGQTFLALCQDKHGDMWTGQHRICDMLYSLSNGLGLAKKMDLPPAIAAHFGDMPHVVFV